MANFMVRVELTNGTYNMYTALRDGLFNLNVGFTKRITDKDGIEWRLPTGNYRIETTGSIEQIIKTVQSVALQLDRTPMIVVNEYDRKGIVWAGLQKC